MIHFAHVVTMVLHRDGRLRFTSEKISLDDAERWVKEGFHVFRIAAGPDDQRWAVNHVGSGELIVRPMISDQSPITRLLTADASSPQPES